MENFGNFALVGLVAEVAVNAADDVASAHAVLDTASTLDNLVVLGDVAEAPESILLALDDEAIALVLQVAGLNAIAVLALENFPVLGNRGVASELALVVAAVAILANSAASNSVSVGALKDFPAGRLLGDTPSGRILVAVAPAPEILANLVSVDTVRVLSPDDAVALWSLNEANTLLLGVGVAVAAGTNLAIFDTVAIWEALVGEPGLGDMVEDTIRLSRNADDEAYKVDEAFDLTIFGDAVSLAVLANNLPVLGNIVVAYLTASDRAAPEATLDDASTEGLLAIQAAAHYFPVLWKLVPAPQLLGLSDADTVSVPDVDDVASAYSISIVAVSHKMFFGNIVAALELSIRHALAVSDAFTSDLADSPSILSAAADNVPTVGLRRIADILLSTRGDIAIGEVVNVANAGSVQDLCAAEDAPALRTIGVALLPFGNTVTELVLVDEARVDRVRLGATLNKVATWTSAEAS